MPVGVSTQTEFNQLPMFLTPAEAAAVLRVSERTIRRWIDAKILPAKQLNPRKGGRWLVAKMDIRRLMQDHDS